MAVVQRLFERLVLALGDDGVDEPLTIGDVYQRLIPYRSVRSEIGVMELASYEHGLLRLLGGEGGYLEVEGETAGEEIRRELASPNPILGIYRDYAEVGVRIVGPRPPKDGPYSTQTGQTEERAVGAPGFAGSAESVEKSPRIDEIGSATAAFFQSLGREKGEASSKSVSRNTTPAKRVNSAMTESDTAQPAERSHVCVGCGADFPAVPGVRFCPYCGHLRDPFPCSRCGTRLEPEWNFCIRCGAPAA